MIRKALVFFALVTLLILESSSQGFVSTAELFRRDPESGAGRLRISQDPMIDTLVSRYITSARYSGGMDGYRIQFYSSPNRTAREESGKARQEFINTFPGIETYAFFDPPSYYKVRAGDFRSKPEATKYLLMVRKIFPGAYLVPDKIHFPDQINN